MSSLHENAVVVDGLIVSSWSRSLFEEMHRSGLTAVNCTCGIWEGFEASMKEIALWKGWFKEHADVLTQVYGAADVERAKREGRVGIILGWQNSVGFGEDLRYVPVFRELGLRIVQLTFHSANMAGSGCMENRDHGLTDFGHDLVAALNEERIAIDLSHVATVTTQDAIRASKQRVAYTHCAPKALKDHPRNKTDDELRFMAESGGMVGVTMFPPFMRNGNDATLDDFLDAIEHTINVCGEDAVGIGTDFTQDVSKERMQWFVHDKGYGRRLMELQEVVNAKEFGRIGQYPNLTAGMERRRWSEGRIRKVLGENWVRFFADVWGG